MSTLIFPLNFLEHLKTLAEEEVFLYLCKTVNFESTKHNRINLSTPTNDNLIYLY